MKQIIGIKGIVLWLLALPLLAACSSPADDFPAPSPALWEVKAKDGTVEGWLFGTIHVLPDGVNWRTETLEQALEKTEWLMVEVSDLNETGNLQLLFLELGMSEGLPPLRQRVSEEYRRDLRDLMAQGNYRDGDLARLETWAAALTLAQIVIEGDPENGVDRALIAQFPARIELEGARTQLEIFDSLPEKEQRDLLEALLKDNRIHAPAEERRLAKMWVSGDLEEYLDGRNDSVLSDKELRAALLTNRNTAWIEKIIAEMPQRGPLMIAVGAAHMIGDDGLPTLLTAKGYTVTRIQ